MWDRLNNGEKLIMGILNVTPDSFYVGSRVTGASVLVKAGEMIEAGVDVLDIGGYSTRPGAEEVSEQEETDRVCHVVSEVRSKLGGVAISVDTFRASVAEAAIQEGADIINDVSGGKMDDRMYSVAAQYDVPYILMHMRGTPSTMQEYCTYSDVLMEVRSELMTSIRKARGEGVTELIIDPGFGFSKTLDQNYELMNGLETLKELGCPLLVGVSRKSMIYKFLDCNPEEALNATSVLNTFALLNGADILRVHDVKEAVEARSLVNKISG